MQISQNINITVQISNISPAEICDFQIFKTYNSVLESEIESTRIRNGYDHLEVLSKKIVRGETGSKIVAFCRSRSAAYNLYTASTGVFYNNSGIIQTTAANYTNIV